MSWFGRKKIKNPTLHEKWQAWENEGAAAALEGKTREDCPYDQDYDADAWNFWVYGNENQQGEMVNEFMRAEGHSTVYVSTLDTPENLEAIRQWHEKANDANRRMRKIRGWE